MKTIYGQTWRYVLQHWWQYLGVATLFAVAMLLPAKFADPSRRGIAILLSGTAFVWPVYRAFLFGTPPARQATRRQRRRFGYAVVLTFFILPLILLVPVFVALGVGASHANDKDTLVVLALVLLGYFVARLLYGTALPAAVAGGRIGPGATLARSWRKFWPLLGQMILGPGLFIVVGFGAIFILFVAEASILFMIRGAVPHSLGAATIDAGVGLFDLIMILAATLLAAVLCRNYLAVEPLEASPGQAVHPADASAAQSAA